MRRASRVTRTEKSVVNTGVICHIGYHFVQYLFHPGGCVFDSVQISDEEDNAVVDWKLCQKEHKMKQINGYGGASFVGNNNYLLSPQMKASLSYRFFIVRPLSISYISLLIVGKGHHQKRIHYATIPLLEWNHFVLKLFSWFSIVRLLFRFLVVVLSL